MGLDRASMINEQGLDLLKRAKLVEALGCFEAALELRPVFAQALSNKGVTLRKMGYPDQALESLYSARDIDPANKVTMMNIGVVLMSLERYDEALEAFDSALLLDDAYVDAWFNRAVLFTRQNMFSKAAESFNKVTRHDPADPQAWRGLGNVWWKLAEQSDEPRDGPNRERAVECWMKAVEVGDFESRDVLKSLGITHQTHLALTKRFSPDHAIRVNWALGQRRPSEEVNPLPVSVAPPGQNSVFFTVAEMAMAYAARIDMQTPETCPPILFYLDPSWKVNATARGMVKSDGSLVAYHSSLTAGLINNTLILVLALLTHRQIFPDVGRVQIDVNIFEVLERIDLHEDVAPSLAFLDSKLPMDTLDAERRTWAIKSASLATWFAMQHEWAHIYCGHIDWLIERKLAPNLRAAGANPGPDTLTLHTMELQANQSAAVALLRGTDPGFARCAGLGVSVLLSLLAAVEPLEVADTRTHPHTTLRAWALAVLDKDPDSWLMAQIGEPVYSAWKEAFMEAQDYLEMLGFGSALFAAARSNIDREHSLEERSEETYPEINARLKAALGRKDSLAAETDAIEWWGKVRH